MEFTDGSIVSSEVLEEVFTQVVIQNPPPYKIEGDWTLEVFSERTGAVIAKCSTREDGWDTARKVLEEATARHERIHQAVAELDLD